ncbi:hypothetical protein [Curtobacterium sp. MCBA15_001]|nr:hypothetical protein [Curtobacterium sp. MCBA15_001]
MLHDEELASLRLELVSSDDWQGAALEDEDLVELNSVTSAGAS